jgi:hypothetical protein
MFFELVYALEGTDPERPRALLPILYAVVIAYRAINPARREQLIHRVEATLRSQD